MKRRLNRKQRFAVIGAGHGGQAMAAYLSMRGYPVNLHSRSAARLEPIRANGFIRLQGAYTGLGRPRVVTTDLDEALDGADVVMVAVPANAHRTLAVQAAPHLRPHQIVVLNPGRTGGALEFRATLTAMGYGESVRVAEAQTFIYASRTVGPGVSRVFSVKRSVPVAALPAIHTADVLRKLRPAFPQFVPAVNVLKTSLDNMGAILHPGLTILNTGRIEATAGDFEYYREGATPSVVRVLEAMDRERLAVARALGITAISASDWLRAAYGVPAGCLYSALQANDAYRGIKAPPDMDNRYIWEDVPTSLVPMASLGDMLNVPCPTIKSMVDLACALHGRDYWAEGRTVETLGLAGLDREAIARLVNAGAEEVAACGS